MQHIHPLWVSTFEYTLCNNSCLIVSSIDDSCVGLKPVVTVGTFLSVCILCKAATASSLYHNNILQLPMYNVVRLYTVHLHLHKAATSYIHALNMHASHSKVCMQWFSKSTFTNQLKKSPIRGTPTQWPSLALSLTRSAQWWQPRLHAIRWWYTMEHPTQYKGCPEITTPVRFTDNFTCNYMCNKSSVSRGDSVWQMIEATVQYKSQTKLHIQVY